MLLPNSLGIDGADHHFAHRYDVKAGHAQGAHDCKVTTFVGQKTQSAHAESGRLQNDGLVSQRVRGIGQRGLAERVGAGQARIGVQQIGFGGAFAEFAED